MILCISKYSSRIFQQVISITYKLCINNCRSLHIGLKFLFRLSDSASSGCRKQRHLLSCEIISAAEGIYYIRRTAIPDGEPDQNRIVLIKVVNNSLYLSTFEATKKWTMPLRNWGRVYGELQIMYEGRLPE